MDIHEKSCLLLFICTSKSLEKSVDLWKTLEYNAFVTSYYLTTQTMKYLQDYIEEAQLAAFKKHGAFFAFSIEQFDEQKQKGVTYTRIGSGLICPKENAADLMKEIQDTYLAGIKQDMEENGKEAIIKRELDNHECYYTGRIDDCVEKLTDYPITEEEIRKVFRRPVRDGKTYAAAVAERYAN